MRLPPPRTDGSFAVERALARRRSLRAWAGGGLTLVEVSQLLWAAQGITGHEGERASPSAGALFPLSVYLVAGEVEGLTAGVWAYAPHEHVLEPFVEGDIRPALAAAALGQEWMATAPAVIVLAATYPRTTAKYGQRGVRYVDIEIGCVAQSVHLQAEALGLGTVIVGAFRDHAVRSVLELPAREQAVCLMPAGRR